MLRKIIITCTAILLSAAMALPGAYAKKDYAHKIVPELYGFTYGDWSAQWWQWAYSITQTDNDPVSGVGQVDCTLGQGGPVYFLAGLPAHFDDLIPGELNEFTGSRECTVPLGTALFFPFVNAAYINEPGEAVTVEDKRAILDYIIGSARFYCGAQATVDGETPYQLTTARTQSPPFVGAPVLDNVFGLPIGTYDPEVISDGFWMMVPPLSKGEHTLTFKGTFCSAEDPEDPASALVPFVSFEMSYDLTVGK